MTLGRQGWRASTGPVTPDRFKNPHQSSADRFGRIDGHSPSSAEKYKYGRCDYQLAGIFSWWLPAISLASLY
jgi:hypothetical protein